MCFVTAVLNPKWGMLQQDDLCLLESISINYARSTPWKSSECLFWPRIGHFCFHFLLNSSWHITPCLDIHTSLPLMHPGTTQIASSAWTRSEEPFGSLVSVWFGRGGLFIFTLYLIVADTSHPALKHIVTCSWCTQVPHRLLIQWRQCWNNPLNEWWVFVSVNT